MTLNSPLDLEQIFVVDLAGNPEIFSFLALILVGFLVGKFKFDNTEALAAFVLFGVIMSLYLPGIYVIINLLVGIVVYYQLAKMSR